MKNLLFVVVIFLLMAGCNQTSKKTAVTEANNDFSFVFMTDIHITKERRADEGLLQAIDTINKMAPDFVLTGGDNIMDALGQSFATSDSLYSLYSETIENLKMPVYNTMGNHEVFGLYESSGVDPSAEEYGKKMYENRLAKRYYSFDHQNWHFIVLDAIGFTDDRHYYGHIDNEQIEWLKSDLEQTGKERPVVISTHIPLLSVGEQIMVGPTEAFNAGSIVTNANEVREIIEQYNTKLVLQGHLHFLEDINYNGIHYITGGAVSAQWWQGPRFGMEEGFLKIDVSGDNFTWQYIDFGWEPKE
ncbi:MAG: metallophosphoesterase [Prolixibacteraceae bacterium]|nr:metallophosphoesterase [Prolixibacteraceae bacterium]